LEGISEHPLEAFLYWNLGNWYEARDRFADAEGCSRPSITNYAAKRVILPSRRLGLVFLAGPPAL
jgi:hypothetical protein